MQQKLRLTRFRSPTWVYQSEDLPLSNEDWGGLPGSVLVDLYLRLRDEVDRKRQTLDPNDRLRAAIAMAVLELSQGASGSLNDIETRVRRLLDLSEDGTASLHALIFPEAPIGPALPAHSAATPQASERLAALSASSGFEPRAANAA